MCAIGFPDKFFKIMLNQIAELDIAVNFFLVQQRTLLNFLYEIAVH